MTGLVEPLAWDSEFFGFPIGRVVLDDATPEKLAAIDAEARAKGLACLYGSLDPINTVAAYDAQRFGHRLVEISQLYRRPCGPFTVRPTEARVRRGTLDDLPQLDAAISTIAPWSRFGADPRFGAEAARRMHEAWVTRAAREIDDRLLAVAEDDSGIIGVSTNVRIDTPRVDFMGVTRPGSGAAQALMNALFEWAGDVETEAGPCAARNVAVIRYVEHCGFSLSKVQYLYHRWLDEDGDGGDPT
jgi:dTDP-4-amino-4,6-dideoxy-D-galactose acyltransferase